MSILIETSGGSIFSRICGKKKNQNKKHNANKIVTLSCPEGRTSGNDVRRMSVVRASALIAPRKLLPPNLVAKFRKE
jgi:hypothetical protein